MNPLEYASLWKPFRHDTSRTRDVLSFHQEYQDLLQNTERLAYLIRSYTVYEMTCAALGHPGGSFSEAEAIAVLFNYVLRFQPDAPQWPMRDVFYLSKCHACPSLYTALALFGYFPLQDLKGYGSWDSHLESHPDWTTTPGIEISGGSLGQIPGVAVGRALGIRRQGPDHNDRLVYALLGDGECNEGAVWEAFMAAGHYKLDNLVVIIDYNKVQAKGFINLDMSIEPFAEKLAAFQFDVYPTSNGHNVSELVDLFTRLRQQRRGKPIAIILNTIKGKKVCDCQYNPNWHTSAPRSVAAAAAWLDELWDQDGRRLGVPPEFPKALSDAIEIVGPKHANPDDISDAQA
ncbi:transketolase [candidate division KSB3 bacterium]|uniref:Transketolase n=1 Tax=candidate division KSB3 bacterium TaxID=2044937 RepID=A0A9D5JY21_9BACT|nr:transketolase [candidate division KSB3 bacterium]MBD3325927.1 transketolase [candidate division KSB3 bacterium]